MEADYIKQNIEFTDSGFRCKYLYRSELAELPLIDNSQSAYQAALNTSRSISRLPLSDEMHSTKILKVQEPCKPLNPGKQ